jgi:hypothetical protein
MRLKRQELHVKRSLSSPLPPSPALLLLTGSPITAKNIQHTRGGDRGVDLGGREGGREGGRKE